MFRRVMKIDLLVEGLNFKLPPGGIVGVIGANGAGKTTLFRMITGNETPDSGELRIGDSVKLGYVDQSRDSLNANSTVWEEISEGEAEVNLGSTRYKAAPMSGHLTFGALTNRRKSGNYPVGNETGCILQKC